MVSVDVKHHVYLLTYLLTYLPYLSLLTFALCRFGLDTVPIIMHRGVNFGPPTFHNKDNGYLERLTCAGHKRLHVP